MKRGLKSVLSVLLVLLLIVSIAINGVVSLKAATLTNIALGKTVIFGYGQELNSADTYYTVAAVNKGLPCLTDGVKNNTNWWVNGVGNPYIALKNATISGPYSFIVDLGAIYSAQNISLIGYGRTGYGLPAADAVSYSVSTDGTTWTDLGTVTLANSKKTVSSTVSDLTFYDFSVTTNASARYVKASFATNAKGILGFGEFEVYADNSMSNIGQGKAVYFESGGELVADANYGVSAVSKGMTALTDGVVNNPNWWVNNGNPLVAVRSSNIKGPYAFRMNIGSLSTVKKVSANFYSRPSWGCDRPNDVTFYVSGNNTDWIKVGTVTAAQASKVTITDSRNPDAAPPVIYTYALSCNYADMMYVKAVPTTNSIGYFACEEFQVMGSSRSATNLVKGLLSNTSNYTYKITGGGTALDPAGLKKPDGTTYTVAQKEASMVSRLTDGTIINASTTVYPSGWSTANWSNTSNIRGKYLEAYRNDFRELTINLGKTCAVTWMRMHFGQLPTQGYYNPTYVNYYVSQDGTNYYQVDSIDNYEAVRDANDSNISGSSPLNHYWYNTKALNVNARYIKIIFPVNVYLMSDELLVYGYTGSSATATPITSFKKYDPYERYVGDFVKTPQTGGIKNEYMAYSGWYVNSGDNEVYNTYKTKKEYMSAIAYVDSNGVPQDWLFDDVTVMGHYYTSRGTYNSYKSTATSGSSYANKADWEEWLYYAFGKDVNGNDLSYNGESVINLEALEAAAATAKDVLGDPNYKVGVKLVVYPAVEFQNNWGTLNGEKLDFTVSGAGSKEKAIANRKKAYQWYIDKAVSLWQNAGFKHLELTGFYYYEETIHESTDRAALESTQVLCDIIHNHATPSTNTKSVFTKSKGGKLYIYQLPYYQSEGYWDWARYGFDYALMQPNYSFYKMYGVGQLKECADLCKYYGLGMQMEYGGTPTADYLDTFEDYLEYADDYGYRDAVVSWYMSTWGCYSMATNSGGSRYIYDGVYDFVRAARGNLPTEPTESTGAVTSPSSGSSYTSKYYPACASSHTTLNTALYSLGIDNSKEFRANIALANGITNYTYTEEQNNQLLALLKAGKLINPDYAEPTSSSTATEPSELVTSPSSGSSYVSMYYPACDSSHTTLNEALASMNIDNSKEFRANIALANGITDYAYTEEQNNQLLALLKAGNLRNPDYVKPAETEATEASTSATGSTCISQYYPACASSCTTLNEALSSLGIDNSKEFRAKIAQINGITDYAYTVEQNNQMLALLKAGQLLNPDFTGKIVYYPACASSYTSLNSALSSIGVDNSKEHRMKIALANGITDYAYTAEQNNQMLALLKAGKLINPDESVIPTEPKGEWEITDSGRRFIYKDGTFATGWFEDADGSKYYFNLTTGFAFTGWQRVAGEGCYFAENGTLSKNLGAIGDADCDGGIRINDVTYLQKIAASIIVADEQHKIMGDVNGDTVIDIRDASLIQGYLARLISKFPVADL